MCQSVCLCVCVSVCLGDFDYFCSAKGRLNKQDGSCTEAHDAADQDAFQRLLGEPFGLYEAERPSCTCDVVQARSRSDRLFYSQHLTEQLDRQQSCAALSWCKFFSTQRLISYARLSPYKHPLVDKPLPIAPLGDRAWPRWVSPRFLELCRDDHLRDHPVRR